MQILFDKKIILKHMNRILKKLSGLFGGKRINSRDSYLPSSPLAQHSKLLDGSEAATRDQLVQVLLRDLVRKSGIPPGWVQCQTQLINSRSRGKGIYVRLVVRHWDERLMKYAFAFQKALLKDIVQFEPAAASWLQGVSWQFEVAASCPLTELPGPQFWQAPAVSAAAGQPVDPFDIVPLPANAMAATVAAHKTPALPIMPVAAELAAEHPLNGLKPLPSLNQVSVATPDDTVQDLERLFEIRDKELANMPAGYESTEPSPLRTS